MKFSSQLFLLADVLNRYCQQQDSLRRATRATSLQREASKTPMLRNGSLRLTSPYSLPAFSIVSAHCQLLSLASSPSRGGWPEGSGGVCEDDVKRLKDGNIFGSIIFLVG